MAYDNIVKLLNDLLTKTCDAEQGYQHSAGKCDDHSGIYHFLESQSELRQSFAKDIADVISRFGREPDWRACFTAKAQEAWNRLRSLVGDKKSILVECQRGEEATLEIYDEYLGKDNLPAVVRNLLVNQRAKISRSLAQIEAQLGGSMTPAAC